MLSAFVFFERSNRGLVAAAKSMLSSSIQGQTADVLQH